MLDIKLEQDKHIDTIRNLISNLQYEIGQLQGRLTNNVHSIIAHGYRLSQYDSQQQITDKSETTLQASIDSFGHFHLQPGQDAKRVVRYPGYLCVTQQTVFKACEQQVLKINKTKQQIADYLSKHNQPVSIKDPINGQTKYIKNGLLYEAETMANHAMLTRKITLIDKPVEWFSYSWNQDFLSESFASLDDYIYRIERQFEQPPIDIDCTVWKKQLAHVIHQMSEIWFANDGRVLKRIRPKPIEPQVKFKTINQKTKIKPCKLKLPLICFNPNGNLVLKQALPDVPCHKELPQQARKYRYRRLHPYFHFYECTPVKNS
ncbi:hypothetical protein [Saccharobesus litoralis]|nr:hypothetical protein [Saccharobesus litoralis]